MSELSINHFTSQPKAHQEAVKKYGNTVIHVLFSELAMEHEEVYIAL